MDGLAPTRDEGWALQRESDPMAWEPSAPSSRSSIRTSARAHEPPLPIRSLRRTRRARPRHRPRRRGRSIVRIRSGRASPRRCGSSFSGSSSAGRRSRTHRTPRVLFRRVRTHASAECPARRPPHLRSPVGDARGRCTRSAVHRLPIRGASPPGPDTARGRRAAARSSGDDVASRGYNRAP